MGFNSVQIRNVIKYAIDTRNEQKSIEALVQEQNIALKN